MPANTLIHRYVEACRAGTLDRAVGRVQSGWVVLGESQFLRGYALIYPDPVVAHLNVLDADARRILMHEVGVLGDALLELTGAMRINYEILGNLEPALHVHLFPRYATEPAELRTRPAWYYDWNTAPRFDPERDAPLREGIRALLERAAVLVA